MRVFVAGATGAIGRELLTDLAAGDFQANDRIRREGVRNLVDAAVAAGARRLVSESVDFESELLPDGAAAVEEGERLVRESGLEFELLRFGLLWGPGTWHERPEGPGFVHVREAAEAVSAAL